MIEALAGATNPNDPSPLPLLGPVLDPGMGVCYTRDPSSYVESIGDMSWL